jgi:hypothetical protein
MEILTQTNINNALRKAYTIFSSIIPNFRRPCIQDVKLTNATSYWANIKKHKDYFNHFTIRLSKSINKIPQYDLGIRCLEESIIHEYIHTLKGCWNHGDKFKYWCNIINRMYGYNLKATTLASEYGLSTSKITEQSKYTMKCEKCGHTYSYMKKPHYPVSNYFCTKCGSKYMTLHQNY